MVATCPECKADNKYTKHEFIEIYGDTWIYCCYRCGNVFGTYKGHDLDMKEMAKESLEKFKEAVLKGSD